MFVTENFFVCEIEGVRERFCLPLSQTANTLAPPTLLTQIQVLDLLGWNNISIPSMICLVKVFQFKIQTFENGKNNGEITFMQTMFYVK